MTDSTCAREGRDGVVVPPRHPPALDVPDAVADHCARTRPDPVQEVPTRRRRRSPAARAPRPKGLRGERGRVKRIKLATRDGARCFYCHVPSDPLLLTFDHYIPTRLWTSRKCHKSRNLVLACVGCNKRKADRLPWPLVWLLLATVNVTAAA